MKVKVAQSYKISLTQSEASELRNALRAVRDYFGPSLSWYRLDPHGRLASLMSALDEGPER